MSDTGAWVLDPNYTYNADEKLAREVLLLSKGGSLLEFGAGLGCYTRTFLLHARDYQLTSLIAVDGASNVQEITHGLVITRDLTLPLTDIPKADWLLCMEVGEHIPPQFNRPFVANLVSHARKGMVLSWSNVCDKGVGHVNCKSEDQVIGMMRAEAFDYDAKATGLLRNVTAWGYLKTTLMVFRRA